MKLATLRVDGVTRAVKVAHDGVIDLGASDLGDFLAQPGWRHIAASAVEPSWSATTVVPATLIPRPSKVVCVGLNYRTHIAEMGHPLPDFPTLFAKFPDALIGAHDSIVRPAETTRLDWEVELAVVIGDTVRRANPAAAEAAIAGFTVFNDVTCRDWQSRTSEWLQGKTWQSTTPVGPFLVTPDELSGGVRPKVDIQLRVNDEVMQSANTADLVFDPVELVTYISTIVTLYPGDIIATGTPAGVGHARNPGRYLDLDDEVVAEIHGVGRQRNHVVSDSVTS